MIRTQVYIPDDLHSELMLLAKQEGVNFSTLVREGAKEVIKMKRVKNTKKWGVGFIGALKGGPKDLSSKIDYYLYGDGNPKWAGK
ncbi:hypothetical protein HZB69_00660 [Candidatus Amesbacteria bacterium]|nr:hypothetical protein [Candidatus Amesbacteria bacterium]